jgi:hypothetical protein
VCRGEGEGGSPFSLGGAREAVGVAGVSGGWEFSLGVFGGLEVRVGRRRHPEVFGSW